jgi:hypothetical protein
MRIVSSNHGTPTARSCCARSRAAARARPSLTHRASTAQVISNKATALVLESVGYGGQALVTSCGSCSTTGFCPWPPRVDRHRGEPRESGDEVHRREVHPVAVWGAESRGTGMVPMPTARPLQASAVRSAAFHRVRSHVTTPARVRGRIVALTTIAGVTVISVPWVTTAMFAPAPVPIRYAMVLAAAATAASLVVDSSSSLRVGQAPRCQFEAASQDGRSRASGTSAWVASKSAW